MTDDFMERLAGTNIDPRSMLCTDYFNHFNEVVMLLSMVADCPELLDEIDQWDFKTYREHFTASSLGFAPLALESYERAPIPMRERFEKLAVQMSMLVVETRVRLRHLLELGEKDRFAETAALASMQLQGMIDDGGAIVHGNEKSMDQSAIDSLF